MLPAARQDEVIRLAFVAQDSNAVDSPREKRAWDEFPAEFAITPDLTSPSQQEVEVEADLPTVAMEQPDFALSVREAPVSNPGVEAPSPVPPTPDAEGLTPDADAGVVLRRHGDD